MAETEIKKIVTGSKEWFAENENGIDELTKVYQEKGMPESKARYRATRDLLEDSFNREIRR